MCYVEPKTPLLGIMWPANYNNSVPQLFFKAPLYSAISYIAYDIRLFQCNLNIYLIKSAAKESGNRSTIQGT
jgi:hypothetical protein